MSSDTVTQLVRPSPAASIPSPSVPSTRPRRLGPRTPIPGQRFLGPGVFLVFWFIGSSVGIIDPTKLSPPPVIGSTLVDLIGNGILQENLLTSMIRAGTGLFFGITIGTTLAVVAGLSRVGDAMFDGYVQLNRAIPNLALLPLAIIWLGIGEPMKIVIISLGVMVPIYINTNAALRSIDKRYVELGETVGLTQRQFIRRVVFPGSLPGFFTGLRLGVTSSWTALVVVETVNATSGIGFLMTQARIYGQTEVVLVGVAVYGTFGLASDALVRYAERRVLSWRSSLGT